MRYIEKIKGFLNKKILTTSYSIEFHAYFKGKYLICYPKNGFK